MRYAARVDANQREIIEALRKAGASVQPLHKVGGGCPDLAVGFRGRNLFFEVKDGSLPPSARRLNDLQAEWHLLWRGSVHVVTSPAEALAFLLEGRK